MDRDLDVVLLGATGVTGALTAAHLAAHAPPHLRWALAGRDVARLQAVREDLRADVPVLAADVTDDASVRRLAAATRVLATTVGPYLRHGEAAVAACAATGTDYVDLTGEPEFVDRMWLAHDGTARRTGARLVHSCGFEAVPPDLGVLATVERLPEGVPLRVRGFVSAGGAISGGTLDSALTSFSRTRQAAGAHARRRAAEDAPVGRRARSVPGRPGYNRDLGRWVLAMPTIDPQVVARSARALERYGPDFTYTHYAAVGGPVTAVGVGALVAGTVALAQLSPTRALLRRVRPAGSGPSERQRARGWFRVRVVGEGGGRRAVTEVSGGDPGYGSTAVMLAESALCLALDDLPPTAGQVTPAFAMGGALRRRLQRGGITFTTLEPG